MPIYNPGVVPASSDLVVSTTNVFSGASPIAWTDLDLSAVVGATTAFVVLEILHNIAGNEMVRFRPNGNTNDYDEAGGLTNISAGGKYMQVALFTDSAGIVEWITAASRTDTINILGYITIP